ncbi:MAG: anti-sigma factor [Planctomycetota bacterium]|jgi:anti-sigma factor RsiW
MTIRYQDLIAYAAGELSADRAAGIEALLATDPGARQTVEQFRAARASFAADDSVAPPAEAVARAKAVFDAAALARPSRWWETLDRIVASLVFDSRVQPAAVRYADAGDRIQLSYEAAGADVELQAERTDDTGPSRRWRLTGQVAADRSATCRVVLLDSERGGPVVEATTDERGMFVLEIEGGRYDLAVGVGDELVVIPALDLSIT